MDHLSFPHSSVGKESACNEGDSSSIPGSGGSPGEGIGYPLLRYADDTTLMAESEELKRLLVKVKRRVKRESCSGVSNSVTPWTVYTPWNSPGQNTGMGSLSLLQGIFPTQGSNPGFPHCRWILYPLSQGKPKNTGVGSLSLLQWIFPTQELNWSLLHSRRILYQLSYQGSPQCPSPTPNSEP